MCIDVTTEHYDKNNFANQWATTDNKPINNNGFFSCYFSGDLERQMGFDIVKHIGGEFPIINDGDILPVNAIVYNADRANKLVYIVKAVMLVGKYNWTDRLYALIMTINDAENFLSKGELEAELGGVVFNKLIAEEVSDGINNT
tara:strand:- start:321 stop:752 length:432 start_codon:yes stop_codon:yes gene_type:complete